MTMEMVGKVEVVSKLVMALMGEMLVTMVMEEAMAMVEAMVWVGGESDDDDGDDGGGDRGGGGGGSRGGGSPICLLKSSMDCTTP